MYSLIITVNKDFYLKRVRQIARNNNSTVKAVVNNLKRNGQHDFLYEALARKMFLEFGNFLKREDCYGEIVAESRRENDDVVLKAFIATTRQATFKPNTNYYHWSKYTFDRIYGLTFQNKRGLSFGLEIADLFGWAYLNKTYGRSKSFPMTQSRRINSRINKSMKVAKKLFKFPPVEITKYRLSTLAADRVSEFTECLNRFSSNGLFGDPTRSP